MKNYQAISLNSFKKLLLFSGWFNIIFALPLALPFTYQRYLNLLSFINEQLGLGGQSIATVTDGVHALLINTAGLDLVLVGTFVLYAYFDPINRLGIVLLNAAGRTLFFFIILYYIIAFNIARIVLAFGIVDVLISAAFIFFFWKFREQTPVKGISF